MQDDLNGTNRSVFMWVKSKGNVTDFEVLFCTNREGTGAPITTLYIHPTLDQLRVNAQNAVFNNSFFDLSGDVWNYVGYTYDATTFLTSIYVNGVLANTFTYDQSTTATSRYSLGQEFDGTNERFHYNGDMAEVSVWNEVLTGTDIRQAMQKKIDNTHPKYTNLKGYYSVFGTSDDDNTVLKDHSGNNNDGIMKNGFTQDFKNVQAIEGFNAIDWYESLSWKKDGVEVATTNTFTPNLAAGAYEFTATRDFIKSTDTWTMTPGSNEASTDIIADETLCEDDPVTRSVSANTVNYLDFERSEGNSIAINSLSADLKNTDYSVFLWVKRESFIANGDFYQLLSFQDSDTETTSRLYMPGNERLTIWDGANFLQSPVFLDNNIWHFVGFTYDATTQEIKLYVNDEDAVTGNLNLTITDSWFATLGARHLSNGQGEYLDGQLAEITIWDKVLTEEEITNLKTITPAHNAANLVAAYGALPNIADNILRDLTGNGHDGVASHESIIVDDLEESIPNYDASAYQTFSWKKNGVEFDTDANATITIEEGSYDYTVAYGSEFFPKTENFTLEYTELIPTAPTDQTGVVDGSATFSVDNIIGATYQWFKNTSGFTNITTANGLAGNVVFDVVEVDGTIYVATSNGLSISMDGGNTFINKGEADGLVGGVVYVVAVSGNVIYAGLDDGMAISKDGGQTFTYKDRTNGLDNRNSSPNKSVTDLSIASDGRLWGTSGNSLFSTKNQGTSFDFTRLAFEGSTSRFHTTKRVHAFGGNLMLSIGPSISLGITKGGNRSDDDFVVIYDRSDGVGSGSNIINDVYYNETQYIATDEGLTILDGRNYRTKTTSNGLASNEVRSVFVADGIVYAATDAGLSISEDGGNTFISMTTEDGLIGNVVNKVFATSEAVYVATSSGLSIFRDVAPLSNTTQSGVENGISGATSNELTFSNLTSDLDQTEYYVVVSKDGCSRQSDVVTLRVVDKPEIIAQTPAHGSVEISVDTDLSIEFSHDIFKGSGNLKVFNYATDAEVHSFSADDLVINGNIVSITSGISLDQSTQYYITMDEGLVQDHLARVNLAVSDKDTWSFSTVCEVLISAQPLGQTGGIGGSATLSVPELSGASYTWYGKNDSWEDLGTIIDRYGLFVSTTDILAADGVLYASTQEGLFISENMGDDWTQIDAQTAGFANTNRVRDVYVSGDNVYVATGAGLSVSGDRGASWSTITAGNGLDYTEDQGLYSVFVSGGKIYAGTDKGLFVSSDNGASWTSGSSSTSGFQSDNSVTDIYVSGNTVYAITTESIWASDDGGVSWNTTNSGENGFQLGDSDLITDLYAEGNTLYITTSYSEGPLFSSVDGGETWTAVDLGFPDLSSLQSVFIHDDVIYAAKFDLFISEDEATSWIEVSDPNLYIGGAVMGISVDNGRVYVITIEGDVYSLELFAPLDDESDNTASNQIQGASTHELTINNLTEDLNETEYFVEVTKATCLEYSDLVTLTVTDGIVDVTPPAAPVITGISEDTGISDSDGITSDQNILIMGTAEPNSTIEVSTQFGPLRNTTTDANGDWVLDVQDITLAQVVTNITVVSVDQAGNRSAMSNVFVLTPDFTAPAEPVITGISDDTGISDSDGITSDQNILIMGTAEANATVEVSSQFGPLRSTTTDANGDWVLDVQDIALVQVVTHLTAEAVDQAGNRSGVSNTFTMTPDFTAPAKPVITGISDDTGTSDSDGITSDQNILIMGTAEPSATVEVSSQFGSLRSTTADVNGDWVLDVQDITLVQVVTNITAVSVDEAGNRSADSNVFIVTPDFTAPAAPVVTGISDDTGVSNSDGITSDQNIMVFGTAEPNSTIEISTQFGPLRNTTADANGDWVLDITDITLIELTVNLTAEAVDEAGNRSATSDAFILTPDFTSPGVTIAVESSSPAGYTISALFDEDVTGLGLGGITVTGGTVSSLVQNNASSYSFFVSLSGSTVDIQVDIAAAQDMAGNNNTISNQLTLGLPPNVAREGFTNLSEPVKIEMITVYPNPASRVLTIDLSELSATEVDIQLYNAAGIPVFTQQGFSQKVLRLDVSSYKSGMYIVQLYDGQQVIRKKVIIKR